MSEAHGLADGAQYVRLDGTALTLVFALEQGGAADLTYIGARLPDGEDLAALSHASTRGRHESQPDAPPEPGLLPQEDQGWTGSPAIAVRDVTGKPLNTQFRLASWLEEERSLTCRFVDERLGLHVSVHWANEPSGMIFCQCEGWNEGTEPIWLDRIASMSLPVPRRFSEMTSFSGRWATEMHETRRAVFPDGFARSSRIGKPGFGGANWLILHAYESEEVLGAHLQWSGDHDTRLECDAQGVSDGRALLQMGAMHGEGGVEVPPKGSFGGPPVLLSWAKDRSALAHSSHSHARTQGLPNRSDWGPRKVHLNSWEALSFDLSEDKLMALADRAAALGIERFVLDDGWFAGRRDDRTSLGDWWVSPEVLPAGLDPVIQRVHTLGMDFGIWVEPEMVSPNSDLYRAHPDWCLHLQGHERPTMRGQLALDLTLADVRDYLFERLDALLGKHAIAYVKWDHNRDLFPNRASQAPALGLLLDRLRRAHPAVEFESCASGGGRIDFGMLARCHRVWPSDNNDPIERVRIMRAWSQFLPLEVLGNHVGPSPNPITGRRTDMDFRAKVALFGHMGVEADPGTMSEEERTVLAAHIALYKDWREVLHSGEWYPLEHPDAGIFAQMVMSEERALVVAAQTTFSREFDAAQVRLAGLSPETRYRVTLPLPWPGKAALYLPEKRKWRDGFELSGRALMTQGLALPLTHPETAWLIALERVG